MLILWIISVPGKTVHIREVIWERPVWEVLLYLRINASREYKSITSTVVQDTSNIDCVKL